MPNRVVTAVSPAPSKSFRNGDRATNDAMAVHGQRQSFAYIQDIRPFVGALRSFRYHPLPNCVDKADSLRGKRSPPTSILPLKRGGSYSLSLRERARVRVNILRIIFIHYLSMHQIRHSNNHNIILATQVRNVLHQAEHAKLRQTKAQHHPQRIQREHCYFIGPKNNDRQKKKEPPAL